MQGTDQEDDNMKFVDKETSTLPTFMCEVHTFHEYTISKRCNHVLV